MTRLFPLALAALTAQPALAEMMMPWSATPIGQTGAMMQGCTSQIVPAPFQAETVFAACINLMCDATRGLQFGIVLPIDTTPRDWPAVVLVDGRDMGQMVFASDPATKPYPVATVDPAVLAPLLQAMATGSGLTIAFQDAPYRDIASLQPFPLEGAAPAIAAFTAACPPLAAGSTLPSFTE